jgi:hypothetical protein
VEHGGPVAEEEVGFPHEVVESGSERPVEHEPEAGEASFMTLFSGIVGTGDVPVELQTAIVDRWRQLRGELDESRPRVVGDPLRENLGK